MKAKSIEELFGTLQQSIVAEWRKHLQTSKYSKHMALDEFYKEMPELVDSLIEAYNGHVGKKVEDFKNVLKAEDLDALKYLEELHELCQSGYDLLPEDAPELKSALDAVKEKIDSVMYKVRELKEQAVQVERSLKDFLCESLVNEAKRLSTYSNYELACEYWDEWSGLTNGVGGTSGNSRARRMEEELHNRYAPGIDYLAMTWFCYIQEYIENKLGYKSDGYSRIAVMKYAKEIAPIAHDIIKQNLDDIFNGKIDKIDNIKYDK